ncbi:MAG TPA: FecR domain-containing protein [Gemmatimonadaceae bacterium]
MTPRPTDDFDYEQLARYFSGECTSAEAAAIRAWIDADEERRRRIELLRMAWTSGEGFVRRGDVDAGWAALSSKIADDPGNTARPATGRTLRLQPKKPRRTVWYVASRAAAILIAVGLGAVTARELGWRKPSAAPPAPAPEMREVTTKRGQRANVYLSDGTQVVLGVGSTLRFPTAFGSTRDVELDGEAYFEVAHDTTRTFAVRMHHGTARDLGTKFGIRAYRDNSAATVTVTEGAVMLTPAPASSITRVDSLVLGALDIGRVSADGRLSVRHKARVDTELAWMSGRLVFDRMPVSEAIAQINRWYDVDVALGDSTLARYTLTASLTSESFPRAIKIIAAALDARVERRQSKIMLFSTRDRS